MKLLNKGEQITTKVTIAAKRIEHSAKRNCKVSLQGVTTKNPGEKKESTCFCVLTTDSWLLSTFFLRYALGALRHAF
jgi:hypothetical protein